MPENTLKVSVIIPIYNRVEFVPDSILSLSNQTERDFEALYVDDGSNDGTYEAIRDYAKRLDFIRLMRRPINSAKGAQTCRNLGFEESKGKYIVFLDSDDVLSPSCLENRMCIMNTHPNLDFTVFPQQIFYQTPGDSSELINIKSQIDDVSRFLKMTRGVDVPWINNSVIWKKTSLIKYNHLWDPDIKAFQDLDFHLMAILKGMTYQQFEGAPDCFWRKHNHFKIGDDFYSSIKCRSHLYLIEKIVNRLKAKKMITVDRLRSIQNTVSVVLLNHLHRDDFNEALFLQETVKNLDVFEEKFLKSLHFLILVNQTLKKIPLARKITNYICRKWITRSLYNRNNDCNFLKHQYIPQN